MYTKNVRNLSKICHTYSPKEVEKNAINRWDHYSKQNYYNKNPKETFSMVLPPPNVTGTLHLGHALTAVIQDVLVRWHKMNGHEVLWMPGTDHAGIATQVIVERSLKKEKNLSRHDLGKDEFLKEVWKWKEDKGGTIIKQLQRIGTSLDWSRHTFTMDPAHCEVVNHAIIKLWDAGLLYRNKSLINWSCALQSAISDIEVLHKNISGLTQLTLPGYEKSVTFGRLIAFAYKVHNSQEELVVSTTRVETMLGDVAVAVHPDDTRYTHLHHAMLRHPFKSELIPVICDLNVDPSFATGAVKITPGHNTLDLNIAKDHNLAILSVINEKGEIQAESCYNFSGMKRFEAREEILNELQKMGLLREIKPHSMQIPICSRSGDVIEYIIKPQWFIRCKDMAMKAADVVRSGTIVIEPPAFQKNWYQWLDNINDWCISRQIWWGHQLPLYQANGSWIAAHSIHEAAKKLSTDASQISQDADVLDTWFSSALFPLTCLGWPNETENFKKFYPLSIMETGHDILFFWVARMVMLGMQLTGQIPFKKILLHGIVCDAHGRKMSKSLGNVVSPEDVINGSPLQNLEDKIHNNYASGLLPEQEMQKVIAGQKKLFPNGIPECGTDALRFTLLSHNTKNHFINFDVQECLINRQFCNKIWQASRYTILWISKLQIDTSTCTKIPDNLSSKIDVWIISRLSHAEETINSAIQSNNFHLATSAIKKFLYRDICDIYLEGTKKIVNGHNSISAKNTCCILLYCLNIGLRLNSIFMPFISEEIWHHLPGNPEHSITLEPYPSNLGKKNHEIEKEFQLVLDIVDMIQKVKVKRKSTKQEQRIVVESNSEIVLKDYISIMESLVKNKVELTSKFDSMEKTYRYPVGGHSTVVLVVQDLNSGINEDHFNEVLKKQQQLQKELDKINKITSHESYIIKVSENIKLKHSNKIESLQLELNQLNAYLETLMENYKMENKIK